MSSNADQVQGLCVVRLDETRLDDLLAIQASVCNQLERPELYFPVSSREMHEFFGLDGFCFGVEHGPKLVGFFGALFMGDREENVGNDLGLSRHELPLVAYFKTCNILLEYRGMGLQKRLTQALFAQMGVEMPAELRVSLESHSPTTKPVTTESRPERPLCATVSPHNVSSLKSLLDCGFWIAGLKPKYGGFLRYLVMRRPRCIVFDQTDSVFVSLHDYAGQEAMLKRGMLGVQLCIDHQNTSKIKYVRSTGISQSTI